MATLPERIDSILAKGPGKVRGWIHTSPDGSFEVNVPFEDGFRLQGYYLRAQVTGGKLLSATYEAGKTILPKTAFYESRELKEYTPISPHDFERHVTNLINGRT
jgi:hypothetical protein